MKFKWFYKNSAKLSFDIRLTFWSLAGCFLITLLMVFIPILRSLFQGSKLFLVPLIIYSFLGFILLILTIRSKLNNSLKKFLILSGFSSAGFFVFVLLHNFFYGLSMVARDLVIIKYPIEALHIIFFLVAIFICPAAFLVGMIGTIALLIKDKSLMIKK